MREKIVVLLALALLLTVAAAFAVAETELTVYAPNGVGMAGGSNAANKSLSAADKEYVYPNRGGTVNLWYWYDDYDGGYNMDSGADFNGVRYTVRGSYFRVEVTQGTDWLGVRAGSSFGSFEWSMADNHTTKVRTGRIRVSDSRGTICNIVIKQCCHVEITSIRQLGSRRVRLQTSRTSGNSGKVVYYGTGHWGF